MEEEIRRRNERRWVEENALEGLRRHLASVFGGLGWSSAQSVEGRIDEVRKAWRVDVEALCRDFEDKEGRVQW